MARDPKSIWRTNCYIFLHSEEVKNPHCAFRERFVLWMKTLYQDPEKMRLSQHRIEMQTITLRVLDDLPLKGFRTKNQMKKIIWISRRECAFGPVVGIAFTLCDIMSYKKYIHLVIQMYITKYIYIFSGIFGLHHSA